MCWVLCVNCIYSLLSFRNEAGGHSGGTTFGCRRIAFHWPLPHLRLSLLQVICVPSHFSCSIRVLCSYINVQTGESRVVKYKYDEPAYVQQIKLLAHDLSNTELQKVCIVLRIRVCAPFPLLPLGISLLLSPHRGIQLLGTSFPVGMARRVSAVRSGLWRICLLLRVASLQIFSSILTASRLE